MWYAAWFESIVDYIMNKIWSNEEITKALRIKTTRYPEIALREFIANALIHQDLSITWTSSVIEIYPNRIEIINPWAPLIDIDRFIDHPAMSRNTDLAKMMRSLWFCEESGSWVDRALESIEVYQLPAPKFETYEIFTKVTLYAPKEFKHMSQEDRVRACYQHCTLQYVLWINRMSNSTLRKRFNIPESNYPLATKIINEAKEKGKIKVWDKPKEYIPYWA
jgi:predicted HTH transcriptional regulator